jgi:hypothetical protein
VWTGNLSQNQNLEGLGAVMMDASSWGFKRGGGKRPSIGG